MSRVLNLGSGNEPRAAAVNLDLRRAPGVNVVADVRRMPFAAGAFPVIYASSLLEHFQDPYSVLDEIHRVLADGGRVEIRVPSPWSVWGQLDRTHTFLADLRLWRDVLDGYFARVIVGSEGSRYRDSRVLRALTLSGIRLFGWHELAEVWRFECTNKRAAPQRRYIPWWLEA
jgi:ubiquinone/menaquinone biosynthesis C-methylase UbiE